MLGRLYAAADELAEETAEGAGRPGFVECAPRLEQQQAVGSRGRTRMGSPSSMKACGFDHD